MESKQIITIVIVVLVGIFGIFLLMRILGNDSSDTSGSDQTENGNNKAETGRISGTIQYSGIKPKDGKEGFVFFEYREHNSGEFTKLAEYTVPLVDNAQWSVDGVPLGKLLDARAVIELNSGERLATSNMITTSAPAVGEVFEFNVTLDMIPDYILENNPVIFGGTVTINGYIPPNSTLSMFTKAPEDADFTEVVQRIPVTGSVTAWQWDNAIAGTLYELKAEAYQTDGSLFASSFVAEKAAPSDNANFILTSRAIDPNAQQSATISGTVKINGEYSNNAELKIKARVSGESEYKTVATLKTSNDPQNWSWTEAVSGVTYDIKPYIVESGQEDIAGNKVVTAAPASGIKLKVDTNESPDAPSQKPELLSCDKTGDNKYNAKLSYGNVEGAVKYWLQVGKSEGASDVNNSFVNNSSNNDAVLVSTINAGQDYYTRYAYTECSDCSGTDSYSEFSDSLKFKCE